MAHRFPTQPRPGTVPSIVYEFVEPAEDDSQGMAHHYLRCTHRKCGWFIRASNAASARWAGQSHMAEHLGNMVQDPEIIEP